MLKTDGLQSVLTAVLIVNQGPENNAIKMTQGNLDSQHQDFYSYDWLISRALDQYRKCCTFVKRVFVL
jgi:hypothetical protein